MKSYIDYNETLDPDANSYQGKLARKSKALIPEERQGHLNRMKKSYKSTYHEKESMIPVVKIPAPQSFIQGPDTLIEGEPGIFFSRAFLRENESFKGFPIQSVWKISTPANMNYDQRIIDSIPPYEGKEAFPEKYAKPGNERRWSTDGLTPTKRWNDGDDDRRWSTDSGKKRWEGYQELAEDTGNEEGFCRAEFKFNNPGMVRLDATPISSGVDYALKSISKYVTILPLSDWFDDFNDNSIDSDKWWDGQWPHAPFGGNGPWLDCDEINQHVEFVANDPTGGNVPHFYNRIHSRCPKDYFDSDFTISVDFSNFTASTGCETSPGAYGCLSAYLMFNYGSGSDDWYTIEFYCNCAYGSADTVQYRWGYQEYGPEVDHFTYGSTQSPSIPESGTLKIRRRGAQLQFWNAIDNQWESIAFPVVTENTPISVGVWACHVSDALPHQIFYDNFLIIKE